MREIKFRAWADDFKMMFYSCSEKSFNNLTGERGHTLCGGEHPQGSLSAMSESGHPIMQFTGIKDKNGKEIYEGDIVSVDLNSPHEPEIMTVEYGGKYEYAAFGITGGRKPGMFGANPTWDMINPSYAKDMTVIGNIYETPFVNE